MSRQPAILVAPVEEHSRVQHCFVNHTGALGSKCQLLFVEGVTCDQRGVIGLDLSNESISGQLDNSSDLSNLRYLQKLNLACNHSNSSQITYQLAKLKNLSYLNLSSTGFAQGITLEISNLTSLVTLDLSWLSTWNLNVAKQVRNLPELEELYLDGVPLSHKWDQSIGIPGHYWCQTLSSSLPNLRLLSMSSCFLSGPIDSSLRNLRSLSILILDFNDLISAPVPEFFAEFENLTSFLKFSKLQLEGKISRKDIPGSKTANA
ncbi:Leucine-rich repeat receptor-like serine/threonine-protein kinase BAM2 [Morella rubra]|uniref:Leucine-rich repeat receptor-like serine/threonine-protein kinase BAM2 n=1 Tax=Morella rubra TaxID=262757 RepID=A0A6A1WGR0_9ROSI|nr:Leucine-rich repeat receptor-like serine/threonine-protein kinase BAM2 [Morella rubra]